MTTLAGLRAALECGRPGCSCDRGRNRHCPTHDDRDASLTVDERDGMLLVHCKAGCAQDDVLNELQRRGLWEHEDMALAKDTPRARRDEKLVATYEYRESDGTLVGIKERYEYIDENGERKKRFEWHRPGEFHRAGGISLETMPLYRAERVAQADPSIPVIFVEGEKCVEVCEQQGLLSVTVGGGSSQPAKSLAHALQALRGRHVRLWPDNDQPGRAFVRLLHTLLGDIAASVVVIGPPGPDFKGADAADYFAAGGSVRDIDRPVSLADPGPAVVRAGDDFRYEWTDYHVAANVTGLRDGVNSVTGEVHVRYENGTVKHLTRARLDLLSPSSRDQVVRALVQKGKTDSTIAEIPWSQLVETLAEETVTRFRKGAPVIRMNTVPVNQERRMLLTKLMPLGEASLWLADGGSYKSTLAACLAGLTVATGTELLPGIKAELTGDVLYLDWESTEDEHARRLRQVCWTYGLDADAVMARFHYQTQYRSLVDQAEWLRMYVAEHGIRLVIVDSYLAAVKGDASKEESATQFFNTLRSLPRDVSSLVITHISKEEAERKRGRTRAYGNVTVENRARSIFELRKSEDGTNEAEGYATVGFYHRKANGARLERPFGVRIEFQNENPARLLRVDLTEVADLESRISLPVRIRSALAQGRKETKALALMLDVTPDVIRTTCRRMSDVRGLTPAGGAGKEQIWELRAPEDDL